MARPSIGLSVTDTARKVHGTDSAAAAIANTAAANPQSGNPATGPCIAAHKANPAGTSGPFKQRSHPAPVTRGPSAIGVSPNASAPVTAATGLTPAASRAGKAAARSESGHAMPRPNNQCVHVNDGTVAAVATYSVSTVVEVRAMVPAARSFASGTPTNAPTKPSNRASPRNKPITPRLVTPTVRSMPISRRRVITETDTVL